MAGAEPTGPGAGRGVGPGAGRAEVALAHDYATQRGGAERVALMMAATFPEAAMYTTLHHPAGTFPEFDRVDLRTGVLDRVGVLRRHHRLALPLLAPTVQATRIDAEVLLASSTGWAHGYRTTGRKVVYCHAPARWLYQGDRYLGRGTETGQGADAGQGGGEGRGVGARRWLAAAVLGLLSPTLRGWDRRAALGADRYLANSTVTARAVREVYGIEAQVLPPPPAMGPDGPQDPVADLDPGYLLCVARLLPYKNVAVLVEAVRRLPGVRLVVVGDGPQRAALERQTADLPRVRLLGRVDDARLRWLYAHCAALVAASYEDYGLSPLEAAAFGRPSVVLGAGGYLDTVRDQVTGVLFDRVDPEAVAGAVEQALGRDWSAAVLREHAADFGLDRFAARLRAVVAEELAAGRGLGAAGPAGTAVHDDVPDRAPTSALPTGASIEEPSR